MGLICHPQLLIADEPTTALDVTIQAQILELMKDIQKKTKMGIIFITHNLGVVADICDKVSVMYAGKMVEQGPVDDIFYRPAHPYTKGLLRSMPRVDAESYERLIPIEEELGISQNTVKSYCRRNNLTKPIEKDTAAG